MFYKPKPGIVDFTTLYISRRQLLHVMTRSIVCGTIWFAAIAWHQNRVHLHLTNRTISQATLCHVCPRFESM